MDEPPPFNTQIPPQQAPPGFGPPAKNHDVLVIGIFCFFVLGFCAVAVLLPMFNSQNNNVGARRAARLSNIKQVGMGCLMYANVHKNHLPDMKNMGLFEIEVEPYLKSSALFFDLVSKEPIVLNSKLSKVALETIDNPSQKVLAYNPTLESNGLREVVFADGHAKTIQDDGLQADLKK